MTAAQKPGLRERKKQRTREVLVDLALELFTADGFDATTLDRLCDAADVSKRTFFRMFAGKEEVALAPLHDMWRALATRLGSPAFEPARDEPVFAVLAGELAATITAVGDAEWTRRAALAGRLADSTPSVAAFGLGFCEATTREVIDVVAARSGTGAGDVRLRLCLHTLIAAWNLALAEWSAGDAPTRDGLLARLRGVVDVAPESLTFRC